ncbi:o-succinylbenzoate synthase [uncultured Enterococcus sp.]|uniref:o-succinylbenzoate synthase n=1 Tax=uncultured Enterococcus sp. TaxID=167972 RepID=UPI00261BE946|nr:o-succinylbenzoate synthase [uncultured Enterococcus sp.]
MMKISNITLYHIQIPFKQAIQTSYGQLTHKECVVLTLQSDQGLVGLGELTALPHPDYVQEFLAGELLVLKRYLIPLLADQDLTPQSFMQKAAKIRGHQMAKAAIEMALWDLYAKSQDKSIRAFLPPTLSTAPVGISLGIQSSPQDLLAKVDQAVLQGYQRVKVKIAPGKDYDYLAPIRQKYPNLCLMADANASYTMAQTAAIKQLDELDLAMIEQPLRVSDFVEHAKLQAQLSTPICLDENICQLDDLKTMIALHSGQVMNLKLPRVGGLMPALEMLAYAQAHQFKVWVGGMYEAGIARAFHLHFASIKGLDFPADLSATQHYFEQDVITQSFVVENGEIKVPKGLGIGVELDQQVLARFTLNKFSQKI